MGLQCSMPTAQTICVAAWKAYLSSAVMQRSLGRRKMCGMKFSAASLVVKGLVSSLFFRMIVRKTSRISWIVRDWPRIILYKGSGMPPSITLWRPISPVYRNLSTRGKSVLLPPSTCLLMASTKTGVSSPLTSGLSWRKGQEQAQSPFLQEVLLGRELLMSMSIVKRFTTVSSQVMGRWGSISSTPSSRQSSTCPIAHLCDMNRCLAMQSQGSTCRNIRSTPALTSVCTSSSFTLESVTISALRVAPISWISSMRSMSPWLASGNGFSVVVLVVCAQTDSRWLKRQSSGVIVLKSCLSLRESFIVSIIIWIADWESERRSGNQRPYSPRKSKVSQKLLICRDWSRMPRNQDQICSTSLRTFSSKPSSRFLRMASKRSTTLMRERRQLQRGWDSKVKALILRRMLSLTSRTVRMLPFLWIDSSSSVQSTSISAKRQEDSAFTQWCTAFLALRMTPIPSAREKLQMSVSTISQCRRLNSMLLRAPQSSSTRLVKMQWVGFSGLYIREKMRHPLYPWTLLRKVKEMFSRMISERCLAPLDRTASSISRSMLFREIFSEGFSSSSLASSMNSWMKSPCSNSMIFLMPFSVRSIDSRILSFCRMLRHFSVIRSRISLKITSICRLMSSPEKSFSFLAREATSIWLERLGLGTSGSLNWQSERRLRRPFISGYMLKGLSLVTLANLTVGLEMVESLLLMVWYLRCLGLKKAKSSCLRSLRALRQSKRGWNSPSMFMQARQSWRSSGPKQSLRNWMVLPSSMTFLQLCLKSSGTDSFLVMRLTSKIFSSSRLRIWSSSTKKPKLTFIARADSFISNQSLQIRKYSRSRFPQSTCRQLLEPIPFRQYSLLHSSWYRFSRNSTAFCRSSAEELSFRPSLFSTATMKLRIGAQSLRLCRRERRVMGCP